MSVISVACMPNREGSECHRDDKRKSAIQKEYFNGLRPAVFRAGLQKDHGLGDCPQGGGLQQLVPEYFPRQRRRTDRAGGVHVRKSVFHGAQSTAGRQLPPVCVYAVETAKELFGIFGPYQPELTLEKKLRLFLMMSLRAYHVPEAEIAQAVAFIEGLNMSFDDAFDVSGYAVPAMQWACGAGVMQGANGKLLPTAEATRAQTAAMLHRFCEDVLKQQNRSALLL